jgi:hypothetical protein
MLQNLDELLGRLRQANIVPAPTKLPSASKYDTSREDRLHSE